MRIAGDIQLDGLNIVFDQASGTATTLLAGAPAGNITLNLPITADTLVGRATTDTLTNKTVNASNNIISNLTVAMLAAGVLNTSATLTGATDSQVPSALAAKDYADSAATAGLALKADKTTTITAGTGLSGGGDLSANRTFNIADTAVTIGSYGSATAVATFTVDQQGRLTAAGSTTIQITQSQVTDLVTDLANKASSAITLTAGTGLTGGGDLTANRYFAIANTGVTATGYGSASAVPVFNVNAQGQITTAVTSSIQIAESQVTNLVTDLGNKQPLDADLTALAAVSATGMLARTGAGTAEARTITGTANRVTVADGDGVAGNPTLDIGTDVVTKTGTQALTNKDFDGGTASDTSRITVPKGTFAAISALTRKEGTLLYATDLDTFFADDGTTLTAVGSGSGSGSGQLNIVDNPSAASSASTGVTLATNYSAARGTSSSPLAGVIDTCFEISTTTASSETSTSGFYMAGLACPTAIRSTKLQVSMYVIVPASSLGVWRLSIYNSGGTRVSLSSDSSSVTTLPAGFTGQFNCTFDGDTSATYTTSLTQTTRSSANTLYVTNIVIGNGIITQGAALSDWQTFTPSTTSSWTTNATWTGKYRREGSMARIKYGISLAGAPGGTATLGVNLPTGLTLDTTNILALARAEKLGTLTYYQNANAGVGYMLQAWAEYDSTVATTAKVRFLGVDDVNTSTHAVSPITATFPNTWGSGDYLEVELLVPIAEWAGNGTVNLGAGAQVEYAYNSDTSAAANNNAAYAYGPSGSQIGSITATIRRGVNFQYAPQNGDQITLELWSGTAGDPWLPVASVTSGGVPLAFQYQNGNSYGLDLTLSHLGTEHCTVTFGQYAWNNSTYGAAGVAWSAGFGSYYWRVKKAKPSAPVGFGLAGTDGSSGLYKAGQAPGLVPTSSTATAQPTAGYIGEYKEYTGTSLALPTTGTIATVGTSDAATVSLTPGVWDLYGFIEIGSGSTITTSYCTAWFGTATGTGTTGRTAGLNYVSKSMTINGSANDTIHLPTYRVNVTSTTSYYLKIQIGYSGGTITANALIRATRIA